MISTAPIPAANGARLCYPRAATTAALLRSGAGLALTLGPLAIAGSGEAATLILGGLGLVFALYGARALVRAQTEIVVSQDGIRIVGPLPTRLSWDALVGVRLRYYTTRRDGGGGWMVLTIRGTGRAVHVESTIEGFASLLARAIDEARARDVALPTATWSNLRPFGITADERPAGGHR